MKYHVNRKSARKFAAEKRQRLYYAIAEDRASAEVLAEKPRLDEDKVTWLQRHGREAGGLYGTLPLCIGMPVAATDHLDRERGVLRGCSGRVCGWTHDIPNAEPSKEDGEVRFWTKLPTAVHVQFKTKRKWRVKGMGDDCILPVTPVRRAWHLDHRRKYPKLKVSRPAMSVLCHHRPRSARLDHARRSRC